MFNIRYTFDTSLNGGKFPNKIEVQDTRDSRFCRYERERKQPDIVRCKDCAYSYIEEENGEFFRYCDYFENSYGGYEMNDDDFCSRGERWVED